MARRFDAGVFVVQSDEWNGIAAPREADNMNFKWVGPVALLAALVIGDQIRINRPGHKYRLTVEVETPQGVKSASGVMAVHPDRSYSHGGDTQTNGGAGLVRSRRRQKPSALVAPHHQSALTHAVE